MKRVGLVGGISWVSTIDYYRFINAGINSRLGGLHSAECIIYSLDFGALQAKGWDKAFELLFGACSSLKESKVDAIALCANTAHIYAESLEFALDIPIIHIGDATAKAVKKSGLKKVGLLGTKFTMEMDFMRQKFEHYGLEMIVPGEQEVRDYIQRTVKEELGIGLINPDTKSRYLSIVADLIDRGAEGIVLGCTEIPLLIGPTDLHVSSFDTTKIHSDAIVDFILS